MNESKVMSLVGLLEEMEFSGGKPAAADPPAKKETSETTSPLDDHSESTS